MQHLLHCGRDDQISFVHSLGLFDIDLEQYSKLYIYESYRTILLRLGDSMILKSCHLAAILFICDVIEPIGASETVIVNVNIVITETNLVCKGSFKS